MKYAIISDVHANFEALESVIADAKKHGADKFVCLGDVVGYGPRPADTLELVKETCFITLAGNHDDAVSGRGDSSEFIDLAKDAVERHRAALSEGQLAWLRSLPYTCTLDRAIASHGDVVDPKKFYYILNEQGAEANFSVTDAKLVFVGHTHEPAIFLTGRSGTVYKTGPQDFTIEEGKRYIVNPGSVGYPRECNGQCFSSYVLYDSTERTVVFRYIPFQVSSVMQRGASAAPMQIAKKHIIAAACAIAALVAALVVWALVPKSADFVDDPALTVDTKELVLNSDLRSVSANLTLARESAPLQLRVIFETPSGMVSGMESITVKQSSRKRIKIPEGSARARFTLQKTRKEDSAKIVYFAPSASTK